MIGTMLAHYRIVEKIGAGGMGEVYRATDSRLGRDVALKVLPAGFTRDAERMARFEREARVLASLNHSGIASIFGIEQDDGVRFLAMELAEGEDLAQRLARGPVAVKDALEVARQIAEALEEAHGQGIVHRDLKPANIKVSPDGKVKILDFGLAKALTEDPEPSGILENSPTITPDVTRAGVILGTAAYMSPEQARGQVIDARTDIWAFGCVLYEMLTGSAPFAGATASDMIAAILEHEPDWDRLPDTTPSAVRTLLRRCLRKEPQARIHAIADARLELEELASGSSTGIAGKAAPSRSRGARWLLPVVGLVGVAVGAFTFSRIGRESARPAAPAKLARLAIPLPDEAPALPTPERTSVAISPDGRMVVYVSSALERGLTRAIGDVTSETMLYLRSLDGNDVVPIDGTVGAIAPFFSPDGQWIGFLDNRRQRLKKVSLAGGAATDLCPVALDSYRGASWAKDGRIFFATASSGIRVVTEGGGQPRNLTKPDRANGEKTHRFPEILPGGRAVVFTRGSSGIASYDDAQVALLDLESGEIRVLVDGGTSPRYVPTGHIVFARAGRLLAVPFDLDALEVRGPPFPVLEDVVTSDGYGSAQFDFSDDGTLVYIRGGPDHYYFELFDLYPDGRAEPLSLAPGIYSELGISPDGTRVVTSVLGANASLWIYDLGRETLTRLTESWDCYAPVWAPDGKSFAFATNRYREGAPGTESVWTMSADGQGDPRHVSDSQVMGYAGDWSPDGRYLFFSGQRAETGADISVVDLEAGGEAQPLIAGPFREFQSKCSPDGRWIAYVSDESGQTEIYVQSFPITGRKWKISSDGGDSPLWAPDGRRLYYWNSHRLMEVPVRLGPEFVPSRARVLIEDPDVFDVQAYDIYPDGSRFLVVGRLPREKSRRGAVVTPAGHRRVFPAMTPDLHVVLNWFAEFER